MRLLAAVVLGALAVGCAPEAQVEAEQETAVQTEIPVKELIKQDVKVGAGVEAVAGKQVTVHYTGWLYDATKPENKGSKFDSSRDRNEPFPFGLGAGEVIPGWDEGVAGMKVGGQRTLTIPPDKAYGARGAGGVI